MTDTPEISALRRAFEEWASTHFTESRLLRHESGEYNPTIDFIWQAFQAGAKTTKQDVSDYAEWHPCLDDNCPYCKHEGNDNEQ